MVKKPKNKFLTFILSLFPGTGHFYLGLMNRGLQLMFAFIGGIFLVGFVGAEQLALFLPVIWFYTLFDAMQMAEAINSSEQAVEDTPIIPWGKVPSNNKLAGWGLVIFGCFLIVKQTLALIVPDYYFNQYIRTAIIAILLIAGGVRILMPRKERSVENNE